MEEIRRSIRDRIACSYSPNCGGTVVDNGDLLAQCLQILLRDTQSGQQNISSNGNHLLQDVLLATQLLNLVEQLQGAFYCVG